MNAFFRIARWMSRRNGRSIAQAVAAAHREAGERLPLEEAAPRPSGQRLPSEGRLQFWREVLESRTGWRRVNPNLFEFRTGDRLTLSKEFSSTELIAQMTAIEIKPLGEGLPPEARKVLCTDAVGAATAWWQQHGGKEA